MASLDLVQTVVRRSGLSVAGTQFQVIECMQFLAICATEWSKHQSNVGLSQCNM